MSPAMISAVTRNGEVVTESIPMAALMVFLLSLQGSLTDDPVKLVSIMISLAAIAYNVADTIVDLDQDRVQRLDQPDLHCLLQDDGSNQLEFTANYIGTVFFFVLCKIATLLLVLTHAASPAWWVVGWLWGEYVVFQGYLFLSDKMWPANVTTGLDFVSAARIWVWNTFLYMTTCVIPGVHARHPLLVGGAAFTTLTALSSLWNVAVATAVVVSQATVVANATNATNVTSSSSGGGGGGGGNSAESPNDLGPDALLAVVVVAAALFLVLFALLVSRLSDKARATFSSTESARECVKKEFNSFGRKRWTIKGKDATEDEHKVDICLYFHPSFLPTADVRAWVEANRERWNEEKPEWWTDEGKREHVLACAGIAGGEGQEGEEGGGRKVRWRKGRGGRVRFSRVYEYCSPV